MATPPFDIISVGDTTLDIFLDLEEASVACDIDQQNCKLQLSYADKIPVKKVTHVPGVGNAANNAVGSSRLGLSTALYTILGDDATGHEALEYLKSQGVADDFIQRDKKNGTNFSAVLNYEAERTILVFHEHRTYGLPEDLPNAQWMYFSSLAAGHEVLHEEIPAYIARSGAKLGFNPGTFQLKEGKETLAPVLQATELFILNREEGQRLLDQRIGDIKELLSALHALGPTMVIVTDGPEGAYAYDGGTYYFQAILDGPVIERTGAGDSFSTGCIAALVHGHDLKEALRWGTINSQSVLQYIGAQEGLLTMEQMRKTLADNPQLQPEVI